MNESDALTGPAPTWRPGYDDDTPVYLDVVRAMGVPGLDGPTGGDVVQGEVQPDPPVKHREYTIDGHDADPADPKTWGMPDVTPDPETGPPRKWLEYRMPEIHELALLEDKLLHSPIGDDSPALEETPGQYEPHTMESDDDD